MTYPCEGKGFRACLVWRSPPDVVIQCIFHMFRVPLHPVLGPIDAEEDVISPACSHDRLPFDGLGQERYIANFECL